MEGLTIEELRLFLTEQFLPYVRQPEVFITPISYRPVRVYVGGEVARPGYYIISGGELIQDLDLGSEEQGLGGSKIGTSDARRSSIAPTLFEALQAARGVTPFSQLDTIKVIRKRPLSQGGGKIQTKVNFLRLISNGDEEVNIRLYDGDTIIVGKSNNLLRDQLLAASRTNLTPDFIEVFVSGRVKEPGPQQLPRGLP